MGNQSQITKAIILIGNRDFGRCLLSTRLPTALWPIIGQTALEHLLEHLANQGIQQVAVCYSNDDLSLSESIHADPRLNIKLLDEPLPVGSAATFTGATANRTGHIRTAHEGCLFLRYEKEASLSGME